MFNVPYIGVTGFMNQEQVQKCLDVFPENTDRQLMVGVLTSSIILSGDFNSKPEKYPQRGIINAIFSESPKAFNCLHFSTERLERLYDEIMRALEYGGPKLNGIQLNLVWPDHEVLIRLKLQYPELRIILQISPNLAGYLTMSEWQIATTIRKKYSGIIDYVLIDFSRGTGCLLDLEKAERLLKVIKSTNPDLGIGIAGGLMTETIILLKPLLEQFPELSVDAESRLRTNSKRGGHLIIHEATSYIKEVLWLINKTKK